MASGEFIISGVHHRAFGLTGDGSLRHDNLLVMTREDKLALCLGIGVTIHLRREQAEALLAILLKAYGRDVSL